MDHLPSMEPGGDNQPAACEPANEQHGTDEKSLVRGECNNGGKSRFPISKRVDFAAALGLVIWVWSEMMDTHDSSKLFVQWLIIAIFSIPLGYYAAEWIGKKWTGHCIFILLCCMSSICAYRNTFFPAFSIIPRQQYVEMKNTRYFIVWNNGHLVLSPINVVLFAQFTNLRDKAMTINSYQFEGRTTDNKWELMPTIDVKYGEVVAFVGTNWGGAGIGMILGPAKEGDVATPYTGFDAFPEILKDKMIAAGGTVTGCFFLGHTRHEFSGEIRCRIKDSADKEFVENVGFPGTNYLRTDLRPMTYFGSMVLSKDGTNIAKLPIVPWDSELN